MTATCDVLVVGGGPAGSSCAWALRHAGLDVIVADRAAFPRDKVCAGWITPQAVEDLDLDVDAYRRARTLQPVSTFRTGVIGDSHVVETAYSDPVSYGIRRCEFDDYLLRRSGARLLLETPIADIRRAGELWIVNGRIRTPMLVGAGGHWCPVSRLLNAEAADTEAVIVAREAEFPIDRDEHLLSRVPAGVPELDFCRDLQGYGWSFRKGAYLNVGIGRFDRRSLPAATSEFLAFLRERRGVRIEEPVRWCGHAYLASQAPFRRVVHDGVLLVGDAAGLADPHSGEGIRPAIESGLMAARTILEAERCYSSQRLESYSAAVAARFGYGRQHASIRVPGLAPAVRALLKLPFFVRHLVLNRWFLHLDEAA